MKFLPSEECITEHKESKRHQENIKIRKVKEARKKTMPGRRLWKVHEDSVTVISVYTPGGSEAVAKKSLCWRLNDSSKRSFARGYRQDSGAVDEQKTLLDIERHSGKMMMLVIVSKQCVKSGNKVKQVWLSI